MEIKNISSYELEIKKSKFITKLYPVKTVEDGNKILEQLREQYKVATHVCYAYIIGNALKYNDDKEPSGTAGIPMLNVLEKNNIKNVLAVTIRYFGGTELGTGGLFRAYSKGVKEALNNNELILPDDTIDLTLSTDYNNLQLLEQTCKRYPIIAKRFSSKIMFTIKIPKEELEWFKTQVNETKININ